MINISFLKKRVALQTETLVPDGGGGYVLSWTTLATVWASIKPITGREVFAADHQEGHVTHHIAMRWRSDIAVTTAMRISYGERLFNIRAVLNKDEANRWLVLLVEEGVAS